MERATENPEPRSGTLLMAFLLAVLVLARFHSYLLFHALVDVFTVAVAWSIFFLAWNTRRFLDNHYFLLVGIVSLFVAGIDVFHVLAYKGMGVFPGDSSDLPTQLWVVGRYLYSISFLVAPLFVRRRLRPELTVAVFAAVTALLLASIFTGNFPRCHVEGTGLTTFKVASEYAVSLILLAAAAWLLRRREHFEPPVLRQLLASIGLTIAASMAFTLYVDVYGAFNVAGHLLRFLSFCCLYRAIVVTGLVRPYDLLFRELTSSEAALRAANQKLERTLDALRRSHERYQAFVGNSSEGIFRVEVESPITLDLPEEEQIRRIVAQGRLAEYNDAFARMHGTAPKEVAGALLADILNRHSDHGSAMLRAFVRSGCRNFQGEVHTTGADGVRRCLAASLNGIVQDGRLVRAWGVERDVTEQKRAAAERERLIGELQQALAEVKTLSGLLPICASCKKIRDDGGYWRQVESYFQAHSDVSFSHGICPDCVKVLYPEFQ